MPPWPLVARSHLPPLASRHGPFTCVDTPWCRTAKPAPGPCRVARPHNRTDQSIAIAGAAARAGARCTRTRPRTSDKQNQNQNQNHNQSQNQSQNQRNPPEPDADARPRSTNLDTWSLAQLRTLKVGGNGSVADFFTKHGGSALLPPANSDARGRYTSRQAGMYKDELARRVLADERL